MTKTQANNFAVSRTGNALLALLLIAGTLACYANSLRGVFLLDDNALLRGERHIKTLPSAVVATTRPLTRLTFFLNYTLWGFKPADTHAVNVGIHLTAGMCLYGILRRILMLPRFQTLFGRAAIPIAWTVAALWLTHPLQTASVTYVSQRAEALMGMFYLLTLYCLVRGAQSSRHAWWEGGAVAACALGMASKPVMVTAPVVALLFDRAFLAGSFREALRTRLRLYFGLAATWLILGTLLAFPHESATSTGLQPHLPSPLTYLLTQPAVIVHYLRLAFWPNALCLDYAWPPATSIKATLIPALILTSVFTLSVWVTIRNHPLGFAGLWFFVILAPTSSFLPIGDCAFEHRMYLPLASVLTAVVTGSYWFLRGRVRPSLMIALAGTAVVASCVTTFNRNELYGNEIWIWRDTVKKRPFNLRARIDLAVALSEAGYAQEAVREYQQVLMLIPADLRSRLDAGKVVITGLLPPDAMEFHYFRAHVNLGLLTYRSFHRPREALIHLATALRVVPYREDVKEMVRFILQHEPDATNELPADIREVLCNELPNTRSK